MATKFVNIKHDKAGEATVPESTARVLAKSGWKIDKGEKNPTPAIR